MDQYRGKQTNEKRRFISIWEFLHSFSSEEKDLLLIELCPIKSFYFSKSAPIIYTKQNISVSSLYFNFNTLSQCLKPKAVF